MPTPNHLPSRSWSVMVVCRDLALLGIPVSKINTIMDGADAAVEELCKQLSPEAASAALAIALGRQCATSGVDLHQVIAMAEIANREALAEQDRAVIEAA